MNYLNCSGTPRERAKKMINDIKNGYRTQHTLLNYANDFEESKYEYIESYYNWIYSIESHTVLSAKGGLNGAY